MWCLRRPAGYLMNSSQQSHCTHFEVAIIKIMTRFIPVSGVDVRCGCPVSKIVSLCFVQKSVSKKYCTRKLSDVRQSEKTYNCGTYRSPITVYEKTAFLAICFTPTLLLIFAANKKKPHPKTSTIASFITLSSFLSTEKILYCAFLVIWYLGDNC